MTSDLLINVWVAPLEFSVAKVLAALVGMSSVSIKFLFLNWWFSALSQILNGLFTFSRTCGINFLLFLIEQENLDNLHVVYWKPSLVGFADMGLSACNLSDKDGLAKVSHFC